MAVEVAMVQLRAVSNRRSGLCFVYSRDASEAEHLGMHVPVGRRLWAPKGARARVERKRPFRLPGAWPQVREGRMYLFFRSVFCGALGLHFGLSDGSREAEPYRPAFQAVATCPQDAS